MLQETALFSPIFDQITKRSFTAHFLIPSKSKQTLFFYMAVCCSYCTVGADFLEKRLNLVYLKRHDPFLVTITLNSVTILAHLHHRFQSR